MKNVLIMLATIISILSLGLPCLFWPEKVQKYFNENCDGADRFDPFEARRKSPQYINDLRIFGLFTVGAAGFMIYTMF